MAKPKNKRYTQQNERSAEDRALDRFAEMLIEKIKSIQEDWEKPWFTEGAITMAKELIRQGIQWHERTHANDVLRN